MWWKTYVAVIGGTIIAIMVVRQKEWHHLASTGGNIRAGKNVSNETKWGEKRLGCDLQSGVSAERNVDRLL